MKATEFVNMRFKQIREERAALPPFEFSCGYTLTCFDLIKDGIKIQLSAQNEYPAAIILPPEEADRLCDWWQQRKLPNAEKTEEKDSLFVAESQMLYELERLYRIIEEDVGVTAEQMEDGFKNKNRTVVFGRSIICFLLRVRHNCSTPKIAQAIKSKSHATPLFALRKFNIKPEEYGLFERSDLQAAYVNAKRQYQWPTYLKRK